MVNRPPTPPSTPPVVSRQATIDEALLGVGAWADDTSQRAGEGAVDSIESSNTPDISSHDLLCRQQLTSPLQQEEYLSMQIRIWKYETSPEGAM